MLLCFFPAQWVVLPREAYRQALKLGKLKEFGHWHLFKNMYRFFRKEGTHLLPLPRFSIQNHHNIKSKKGFWMVGANSCPLRCLVLLAGGVVRQVVSVALSWQEPDKGGWKANACVTFWSFYSHAVPCRS